MAVAFVVLSHMGLLRLAPIPGLFVAGGGFYGVCLFFTLSAYLLTALMLGKSRDELLRGGTWGEYFLRRFLRIYPLYACVLAANAAAFAWGATFAESITLAGAVDHLALRTGVGVFWTIPVECRFYVMLPLFVIAATILWPRAERPLAVLFAGGLTFTLLAAVIVSVDVESRMSLWRNLPAFLGGVYAAWASPGIESTLGDEDSFARGAVEAAGWLALVTVVFHIPSVAGWWQSQPVPLDRFHDEPGRFGLLWTVILVAALHGRGVLRRILCWRPLRFLGAISFSVYLLHFPVLKLAAESLPGSPLVAAWLALVTVVGLSTLTWRFVERPCMEVARRSRRLSSPRRQHGTTGGGQESQAHLE